MSNMMFDTSHYQQPIFSSLLEARKIHGGHHIIVEDIDRTTLTYNDLITRSIAIGHELTNITTQGENVGIFLPNSYKTLLCILGLQLHCRVPAMLNYSMGPANIVSACQTAKVNSIITSRRFIELGHLQAEATQLEKHGSLIFLEDLAKNISTFNKLLAKLKSATTNLWFNPDLINPDSPAVVLFTSGSEGTPKGVVLSHTNIVGNLKQLEARISFNASDIVLNFLPMFHSFGFTVGTILPITSGMRTFFYPTPLHFSVIPEIAYETQATIMFGTNTFFAAYAKKANAYDFYNLRYVVAGAEKLQENTRQLWADKFGIRILEGYGATETSPITSVNTPMYNKMGTVGRFMPGMKYILEPIQGINDGGQLHVSGPNIMLGYILSNNPGTLVPSESIYGKGWHDTGDIVNVDSEGFISIRGRSKRFAKIGGEMVSLVAVEQFAINAWPDAHHAVVSIPDAKKGEQIILLTTQKNATISVLVAVNDGVSNLSIPKKILITETIPVLVTGKTNYPGVSELVTSLMQSKKNHTTI
jgi:acyl-[acyl-carrier-protein]-phospholipid O-acyltransferase/long-chain-fatty-acid--[acyl-carrier-protein] ligase